MTKYFLLISGLIILALVPWQAGNTVPVNESKSRYVKDHLIVKLKTLNTGGVAASFNSLSGTYENKLISIASSLGLEFKSLKPLYPANPKKNIALYNKYELETYYIISFEHDVDPVAYSKKFESDKGVDFSEPDFIGEAAGKRGGDKIPNDTYFDRQWGLSNDGSEPTTTGRNGKMGADMNVLKGWEVETGSREVIVAILDSGVKFDHPELAGRLWINTDELRNGKDDDDNGFADDINGYNFAYDNNNVKDDGGHGTNIAGTIGASTNNELGYAGMDHKCRMMICKNLDNENLGEYSWWAASLFYAANNGARIINMSEGGYDYSKTLANAIKFADESGCLIVASMMNKNNSDTYYPASFPEVMAVGATDTDDSRCREFTWGGGSNWGRHISVVAPGNRIYGLDFKSNTNYEVYWSGTSQATAYVSGIASVLLGQDISRKNVDLRDIITTTAVDQVGDSREDTPGWDEYYGYGRVDLFAAVTYGNLPSGNKKETHVREDETRYKNDEDNKSYDEDDKRAKANDKNSNDSEDDKRAKKYNPDKDR